MSNVEVENNNIGLEIENANPRYQKAMKILELDEPVKEIEVGKYAVKAQDGYGLYKVEDTGEWKCNCPDYIKRGGACKHILAVRYFLEVQRDTLDGLHTEKIPISYKQAWSAYNQAQVMEGELFEKLLRELCDTIPEPEQHMGRPVIPMADQLFCAVMKSYTMMSSRRAHTFLRNAEEHGNLEHAPHFNQVSKTLLKRKMTPILQQLIKESARPLASLETDFAIDSSGFSTSKFSAYHGMKHGVKKQHDWIKAHICTGVLTNIVTNVVITDGNGADAPQFKKLLLGTSEDFNIGEVSADKAYSSRANHNAVYEAGGEALIPFKSNAKARAGRSSAWKKAYYYFQLNREEFEARYHKRSNVETTFGAIKAKFGEHLKSKKWVAQGNELLCKILAYNITVLIHEMYVSGIWSDFFIIKTNEINEV